MHYRINGSDVEAIADDGSIFATGRFENDERSEVRYDMDGLPERVALGVVFVGKLTAQGASTAARKVFEQDVSRLIEGRR